MSETVSRSFNAWNRAKKENRFELFEKELSEVVELKKEETQILGYKMHPYDALMDEFEKGCTVNLWIKFSGTFTQG
jgi:carboxypeptidase Taq